MNKAVVKLSSAMSLAVVIATGIAHGAWTGRWKPSPNRAAAQARLSRIPTTLGTWRGESLAFDRRDLERSGVDGCVARRYVDDESGDSLTMLLVSGAPGPIAVHTPDICYTGAGYEEVSAPSHLEIQPRRSSRGAELFAADYRSRDVAQPRYLRVYWAWSRGGAWTAPSNPRVTFATAPVLYKIYVVRELFALGEARDDDSAIDFLASFADMF
jgi:hypothetical protein